MWNWQLEASIETSAASQRVWALWKDVPSWPKWDHALEWSFIEGPFAVNTLGKLKPKGWPITVFQITEVRENAYYEDKTLFPFTKVVFSHSLKPIEGKKYKLAHKAEVKGLLAPILRLTLGRKLKKGLPLAVQTLARMAENE